MLRLLSGGHKILDFALIVAYIRFSKSLIIPVAVPLTLKGRLPDNLLAFPIRGISFGSSKRGIYHEKMPARYVFQTSVNREARQYVFAHWQRFNKHYESQRSCNAWFCTPNLTGSTGDGLANTGNLGFPKLHCVTLVERHKQRTLDGFWKG